MQTVAATTVEIYLKQFVAYYLHWQINKNTRYTDAFINYYYCTIQNSRSINNHLRLFIKLL